VDCRRTAAMQQRVTAVLLAMEEYPLINPELACLDKKQISIIIC
jgi:hypothetical protein